MEHQSSAKDPPFDTMLFKAISNGHPEELASLCKRTRTLLPGRPPVREVDRIEGGELIQVLTCTIMRGTDVVTCLEVLAELDVEFSVRDSILDPIFPPYGCSGEEAPIRLRGQDLERYLVAMMRITNTLFLDHQKENERRLIAILREIGTGGLIRLLQCAIERHGEKVVKERIEKRLEEMTPKHLLHHFLKSIPEMQEERTRGSSQRLASLTREYTRFRSGTSGAVSKILILIGHGVLRESLAVLRVKRRSEYDRKIIALLKDIHAQSAGSRHGVLARTEELRSCSGNLEILEKIACPSPGSSP